MIEALVAQLRRLIERVLPRAESVAQREAQSLQRACCGLLLEIARLDSAGAAQKHGAVAQAMSAQFGLGAEALAALLEGAAQPENRLTSYYQPVAVINKRCAPEQKASFIEWLWRVALADGGIDMYEEQLVRKLADLLYVPHNDFILAKHRALGAAA